MYKNMQTVTNKHEVLELNLQYQRLQFTDYIPLKTNCESGLNDASKGIPF